MPATSPAVSQGGIPHYRMFIGGEWVDTSAALDVVNPATERVDSTVAIAEAEHIDAAVTAAQAAFDEGTWRHPPGRAGSRIRPRRSGSRRAHG